MVKIWTDPQRVYDRVIHVSEQSADETLELVQKKLRKLPLATGELASTYEIERRDTSSDRVSLWLVSHSPYAGAIERGAWLRGRRGPHISGSGKGRHILRDTAQRDFGRRVTKGLRAGG